MSKKYSFTWFYLQIQRYFILTICSKSDKCLEDIRVSNSNEGSTFTYVISNTSQIPANFSATLRAGIADRLSRSAIFKQEVIPEVLPEGDSGQNYSDSCFLCI